MPLRICSNTSHRSPQSIAETLSSFGFEVSLDEVFTPIPAVKHYLRQKELRPFVIVDPGEYCYDTSAITFITFDNAERYRYVVLHIYYLCQCVCLSVG